MDRCSAMSSSDSEKIVPPKKSKAARKTEEKKEDASSIREDEKVDKTKQTDEEKNIFSEEPVLEGKRKRNSPASEQFLRDWLLKHLVEAEDTQVLFISDIYKCYVESCTSSGGISLLEGEFAKILNSIFPKGYALAPGCPYKDAVRKKKAQKSSAKVAQAETFQLKMKDIIMEAIVSLGNPRRGVSMNTMKNFVSGKYPALRLDQREGNFKKVISNLLRFSKLECVRGIGACGFYRLPRTPEEEAQEIAKEKEEAKEKLKRKKEKQAAIKKKQEDGKMEEGDNGEKIMEVDVDEENEIGNVKKSEGEQGDEEDAQEIAGELGKEQKEGEAGKMGGPNEKKAKKAKKKTDKKSLNSGIKDYVDFENPSKIEDTFPLAMTYNCEPKEASISKITKYVTDFYQQDLSNKDKLKKCLETGVEKGYWTQITGTGSGSGTYRLTIEEFDPNSDSDLTGMIMNAIVACTEPKISSAFLLKKYIQEYHPELKVLEQPRKFKQALLRAVASNKIKQLSGIGASGSFQLLESFRPSPSILQGKGSSGSPSSSGDNEDDVEGTDVEVGGVELYQDAYKPRPSKRRGMGRAVESTKVSRLDLSSYPSFKKVKTIGGSNGTSRRAAPQGRGRVASSPKKATKRPASQHDEEDENEEEEEEEEEEDVSEQEYTPKKSHRSRLSVGKSGKKSVSPIVNKRNRQAVRSPGKAQKATKISKGSSSAKKPKLSKVGASLPEKLEERAAKRNISYTEADDAEDDESSKGEALNMASSPRRGYGSKRQVGKNQKSFEGSIQQVSIVLERELESQQSKSPKVLGKVSRFAKGRTSSALANGGKASPGKGKKSLKKKLRGRY